MEFVWSKSREAISVTSSTPTSNPQEEKVIFKMSQVSIMYSQRWILPRVKGKCHPEKSEF